jgi:predicted Fe-Mo cluster-binding NifX family protein
MGAVVAPRFETAEYFYICTLLDGKISDKQVFGCSGCEGFSRVRLLREQQVDCVICGGIKSFYRQLLESLGMRVIDRVSLSVDQALDQYGDGRLSPSSDDASCDKSVCDVPHEDLLCWTRDLFAGFGWQICATDDSAPFAVDLIGRIDCPVCGRPVRIAICCGAHIYRCDQEIREFHDATVNDFHVRAYVYPPSSRLADCCRAFGIQIIDPNRDDVSGEGDVTDRLPLITVRVEGHDNLAWEKTV